MCRLIRNRTCIAISIFLLKSWSYLIFSTQIKQGYAEKKGSVRGMTICPCLSLPTPPTVLSGCTGNKELRRLMGYSTDDITSPPPAVSCVNCNISVNEKYCDRIPTWVTNGLLNRYDGKILFSKKHLGRKNLVAWAWAIPASQLGFPGRVITLSSGQASLVTAIIQCYHSSSSAFMLFSLCRKL